MNKVITPFDAAILGVAKITVNRLNADLEETKHDYTLVFDCNALAKANELTGRQLGNYLNWTQPELATAEVLAITWATLGRFHPEITLTNKTIGAGGLAGLTVNKQIFTAGGTFTIPTGVTSVKATLVGAGGAGGGATAANNGGGGGSGGAALKWLTGLTPGNTITVTVGTGGTGVSASAGNAGGASSISSGTQTITTVTANGGNGGNANGAQSSGGAGGAISTNGDANFGGVSGFDGIGVSGGPGAGSMFGGGGPNSNGGQPGNAALSSGGGGGGAGAGAGANRTGGAGANGIVIFEWVV